MRYKDNYLYAKLRGDLGKIGFRNFKLDLRTYSINYNGKWNPKDDTIIIYCMDKDLAGNLYKKDYKKIFQIAVHELVHRELWKRGEKKYRGVAHDENFWKLYKKKMEKAKVV